MSDHAAFVWVGDFSCFEFLHVCEGAFGERLHGVEEVVVEGHSADVDAEAEVLVTEEMLLVALPEIHDVGIKAVLGWVRNHLQEGWLWNLVGGFVIGWGCGFVVDVCLTLGGYAVEMAGYERSVS